jgi:hypothetical protein
MNSYQYSISRRCCNGHCRSHNSAIYYLEDSAATFQDGKRPVQQSPDRGCAQGHDQLGFDRGYPPLPLLLELEMLDGICDVYRVPVESCVVQGPIEQFTGGTDKWMSFQILLVTRLFAYQHDL